MLWYNTDVCNGVIFNANIAYERFIFRRRHGQDVCVFNQKFHTLPLSSEFISSEFPIIAFISSDNLTVSRFISSVISIGFPMIIFTFAGVILSVPFFIKAIEWLMVTGTIGAPDFVASFMPPALNSRSSPSGLRVPSGKRTIE